MEYRRLGKAGIKVSELSFGSWVTFGNELDQNKASECIHTAFDLGVNFFDNAEAYKKGLSESIMGKAIADLPREQLVISTKIFWGGKGPNDVGLSRKHLIEGTKRSLKRLQLDYVDLLYCHRPDPNTPIEETVRAMDFIVGSGLAFYWGTSEWSAKEIEEAHRIAKEINAIPPTMEQPEYNMLNRERVEKEYLPLYQKYGMGTTIWSPLALGILTGKYNKGVPEDSRLYRNPDLAEQLTPENIKKVVALEKIAKEVGCTLAQLALAWCLKNRNVSSVITGASRVEQVKENLAACEVKNKLTEQIMKEINERIDSI
jgi:voltage-dependent potassium channel beta subunit